MLPRVFSKALPASRALYQPKIGSFVTKRCLSSNQSTPKVASSGSPHANFYKTFARPVAKVLLMATFTYQLSYWIWVKLEKDEIKAQRQDEIARLERELQRAIAKAQTP